jgi:hypothetical protein
VHAARRASPAGRLPAVDPDEADARGPRGGAVRGRIVADVKRVPRGDAHGLKRDVQDARVGLGEAAAVRGDDGLEEGGEAGGGEAGTLHPVDAVGHHPEAIALVQSPQHEPAARQEVAARRQVVEVRLAEAGGAPGIAPDLAQKPPEALAGERGLGVLAPPERRPEVVVDALVDGERGRRAGKAEGKEGRPEGRALRLVEVEKCVIDVEEDGLEAVQGPTWSGR